ncbi:MAG: threonine synthase [Acidobacteriaceae bacterium]
MMQDSHLLRCTGCARVIALSDLKENFRCPECGDLYEVEYPAWSCQDGSSKSGSTQAEGGPRRNLPNPSALRWLWKERRTSTELKDQSGVWRFRELLPILRDEQHIVSLQEGNTPLYHLVRTADSTGADRIFAKHQGMNPTGSFKDTGMTTALSVAYERGFSWVACASTGNTSAAMAAYAARAGMRSLVLIPEGKIAWGKLSQALDYGALTIQLKTDFDGCVEVLSEVVRRAPVYLLNSVNPYRLEGQKTPALEMAEQMDWAVPDHLIVPGGNLANSSALGKAFLEMKQLGLTDRVPKVSVVQAEGANPLYRSMRDSGGEKLVPVEADTRASAIRIGNPASWKKAVKVIRATGGWVEQATEAEIALAKSEIGAEGIGCEPASAVTLVGLKKFLASGKIDVRESVVLLLTGHTLKDSDYTINYHRGTLLRDEEICPLRDEIEITRRNTIELEADPEAVLRELEKAQ